MTELMIIERDGKWFTMDGKEVEPPPPPETELWIDDEGTIHITPIREQ